MPGRKITLKNLEIEKKIFVIRFLKVMIDVDLANLYQVSTKTLKQAVKRNLLRFPEDFMFQLTHKELKNFIIIFDAIKKIIEKPLAHKPRIAF